MLEVYSTGIDVLANVAIPLNNVSAQKGCTAELASPSTIELNKCGVYMVACTASVDTATTIQLYKDGIAQPQAQGSGLNPSFVTLVQVDKNNSKCCCSSPVTLQIINETGTTFTDVDVVVTKIC